MSVIERIRDKIRDRDYYLSSHAEEEVENAILYEFIDKKLTHDLRITRYRIQGPSNDGRLMHVLCRFKEMGPLIIITVYKKES